MINKILINALGIQDSGGITVLEKSLEECLSNKLNNYLIICNDNLNINHLADKYKDIKQFQFKIIQAKGFLYRLYYENIIFRKIIKENNINLIYNFSGSSQFFLQIPQLIKIQNLLFYSKKLDNVYKQNNKFILWLKQIYLKRIIFKSMANNSKYFEIQSSHVKNYMSDFININNKKFYIKSDIDVNDNLFSKPKQYDFTQKIKFLYIVGPHFEYIHKNFIDFINVMLELNKRNIDFEINITLTKEQLENSVLWDNNLNDKTNFLGYLTDKEKMQELFCDNTILISTSIIETLGLHVIEGIKNGIVTIAPDEEYSKAVYGENIIKYNLFDTKSLLNSVLSIINNKIDCTDYILTLQNDLKISENNKQKNIVDIFDEILKEENV
ncbi:MAG: hypothetical protein DRG78_02690 [Epsilonproteobacteria bacterium]|nr:MAG: hypothetical protein DRG78_02690 [Campylobacterota bacterium]